MNGIEPGSHAARAENAPDREGAPADVRPVAGGEAPLAAFLSNVVAGIGAAFYLSRGARLQASGGQFIALVAAYLVLALATDVAGAGIDGAFQPDALPPRLFFVLMLLFAGWLVECVTRGAVRALAVATALAALAIPAEIAYEGLRWVTLAGATEDTPEWLLWLPAAALHIWYVGAAFLVIARLSGGRELARLLVAAFMLVSLAIPTVFMTDSPPLWVAADETTADPEPTESSMAAASEAVLYAQPRLLDDALSRVESGRPGVVDLYYIGFAGAGYQDVFLNEARGVESILQDRFDTAGRGIVLANAFRSGLDTPFATVTALRRALAHVAARMNRGEDILLLFLTSHGSAEHEFEVALWPYRFESIAPAQLRTLLDEAGIDFRIVVVSACYSGGFVPPLASPTTLVVTASHAERTSFGCRNGARWTYFGEAFFAEALSRTRSFEAAFAEAVQNVTARETHEKETPSLPQMAVGEAIRPQLEKLRARLEH
ncbi:MAG TPA: C13 family peptidase [Burkholderiaceae bacterium]|nr:C13 family peptidase [Burkholderiaceae bacterium]